MTLLALSPPAIILYDRGQQNPTPITSLLYTPPSQSGERQDGEAGSAGPLGHFGPLANDSQALAAVSMQQKWR